MVKKAYQKPTLWMETFIMDASIASGCTSTDDWLKETYQELWKIAKDAGTPWEEFRSLYPVTGEDKPCYNTLTSVPAMS